MDKSVIVEHPAVVKLIQDEIDLLKTKLKHYEQIKNFKLITSEFSIANDFLTPKLSLKRRNITRHYSEDLKKLYGIKVNEQLSYHNIKTE